MTRERWASEGHQEVTWEKARKPEEHNIGEFMERECFKKAMESVLEANKRGRKCPLNLVAERSLLILG